MMTVGKPISASGAKAYFKADFVKQRTLSRTKAEQNDQVKESISVEKNVAAEAHSPDLNKRKIEVFEDDENLKINVLESVRLRKSLDEKLPPENSPDEDSSGGNSAAENLIVEKSNVEPTGTAEKSEIEKAGIVSSVGEKTNHQSSDQSTVQPTAQSNDQSEFSENETNFAQVRTLWVGELCRELGLTGEVSEKDFSALARGINPQTGERFIRHVKARTITDKNGKIRQTKTHRAGLDQTINAPKSVSFVAPYDDRIIIAHWRAAIKAIEAIEEFTTAKMGNIKSPVRTGKAAYAAFLHFEARPDFKSGFAAPDLHTHFFEFNFARTADGRYRALETREIYRCQKLATAVYRSELIKEMTAIGYKMRIDGETGAPEIASISRAYIEAGSPRQAEIKRIAAELGIKSTKTVASNYRRGKNFDAAQMRERWDALDDEFGGQAAKAAEQARRRTEMMVSERPTLAPRQRISGLSNAEEKTNETIAAIDFALEQAKAQKDIEVSKRQWITRQSLLAEALNHSPANLTIEQVKTEFAEREKKGELDEFGLDRRGAKNQAERKNRERTKIEINRDDEQSIEKNYDQTGILQSRTQKGGNGGEQSDIIADRLTESELVNRTLRDGEFGGGDDSTEANIGSSRRADVVTGETAFNESDGIVGAESKLTDFGSRHRREDGNFAEKTRTGGEQNSISGKRKRELPDRNENLGSGKSDDRRIVGSGNKPGGSGGESGQSSFKPVSPTVKAEHAFREKSDRQSKIIEVEAATRLESAESLAETEVDGGEIAPVRDGRTNDQTARSGAENERDAAGSRFSNTKDEADGSRDAAEHSDDVAAGGTAAGSGEAGRGELTRQRRDFTKKSGFRRKADRRLRSIQPKHRRENAESRKMGGGNADENRDGIQNRRNIGSDLPDRTQRNFEEGKGDFAKSNEALLGSQSDTVTDRADREGRALEIYLEDGSHRNVHNVSCIDSADSHSQLIESETESETEGKLEKEGENDSGIEELKRGTVEDQGPTTIELQIDDRSSAIGLPESGAIPAAIERKGESHSKNPESNRRAAERAAQVINVKSFSAQLNPRIVAAWTAIIEKTNAAAFLNEIVKADSLLEKAESEEIFRHLDAQVSMIAENLQLPKPVPPPQLDSRRLALTLTNIQTANFEKATGVTVNEKTSKVLARKNELRAAVPPSFAQSEALSSKPDRMQDSSHKGQTKFVQSLDPLSELPPDLKFSSQLEAETLAALLNPSSAGFDQNLIERIRLDVQTNEAAARETAMLVQIAFGGQFDNFTERVRDDLTEQIYYAPSSAVAVYDYCRQLDWQKTTEAFAPVMKAIAEQNQKSLDPPADDEVRNRMLAEFAARQLTEAYESRHAPLEAAVKTAVAEDFYKLSEIRLMQQQKVADDRSVGSQKDAPEFKHRLEMEAYDLLRYEDNLKASKAEDTVKQIKTQQEQEQIAETERESREEYFAL